MSRRHFLSYARMGAAAGILQPAPLQGAVARPPEIVPRIFCSRDGGEGIALDGPRLRVMDPSDVESIAEHVVARRYPARGSLTAPPNEFPYIEFRRPDLPWMFTPGAAVDGRLRPWIVVVVVPLSVALSDERPHRRLRISVGELPDLDDSWAWAHAQVFADSPTGIADAIDRDDGAAVSRLICPRKLESLTWYRACVVPAFKPDLTPSWEAGDGTADVPVYLAWEFRTGPKEDFEDLVRRLKPVESQVLQTLGTRTIDASRPWPAGKPLRELAGQGDVQDPVTFEQDGAFAVPGQDQRASMDEAARAALASELARQLNDDEPGGAEQPPDAESGIEHLTPPIYGRYYPGVTSVSPGSAGWIDDLNLDPRRRTAAAMGTRYVQKRQEFLMARAWEQLKDLEKANQLRRIAELASVTADALHRRHLAVLTPTEMLSLASPARTRVMVAEAVTIQAAVHESPLPDAAATPAFTRITRAKGPLGRRLAATPPSMMVERVLAGALPPRLETTSAPILVLAEPPVAVRADITVQRSAGYRAQLVDSERRTVAGALATIRVAVAAAEAAESFPVRLEAARATLGGTLAPWRTDEPGSRDALFGNAAAVKAAADAAKVVSRYVTDREQTAPARRQTPGAAVDPANLRTQAAARLRPSLSLKDRLQDRITIPFPAPADPFAQVMAHPRFTAPLALAVLNDWPDVVLPGLGTFPVNRVALLQTNPAFIEAFLVGVNHEMNREFLWREFPTDQRGTPFQHFWPRPGTHQDDGREIGPISNWRVESRLGKHLAGSRPEETVLLVRGEVLQRFRNTVVMAAPAQNGRTAHPPAQWRLPEFTVALGDDAAAYVFNLAASGHGADPARWFFVFQEPVSVPRFGLDRERAPGEEIQSWNDVAWSDLGQMQRPPFLQTGDRLPAPVNPQRATWDPDRLTSADVAEITVQRPFRVLFHGRALLG